MRPALARYQLVASDHETSVPALIHAAVPTSTGTTQLWRFGSVAGREASASSTRATNATVTIASTSAAPTVLHCALARYTTASAATTISSAALTAVCRRAGGRRKTRNAAPGIQPSTST